MYYFAFLSKNLNSEITNYMIHVLNDNNKITNKELINNYTILII